MVDVEYLKVLKANMDLVQECPKERAGTERIL